MEQVDLDIPFGIDKSREFGINGVAICRFEYCQKRFHDLYEIGLGNEVVEGKKPVLEAFDPPPSWVSEVSILHKGQEQVQIRIVRIGNHFGYRPAGEIICG